MDSSTPKAPRPWAVQTARATLLGLLTLVILFAAYTWFVLTWSYSSGERAGLVQKFSKKGVISKTWEGELLMMTAPGTMPEKFYFTVRDDAVAERVNATLGKTVVLRYEQHIGIPTRLFGDTSYFVTSVRAVVE
jgi:hypothetical protein